MAARTIVVNDAWQKYRYTCSEPVGKNFDPLFRPDLSPKEMMELGIFDGLYMHDRPKEFPASWFAKAKLMPRGATEGDPQLNYFRVHASQPLAVWRQKGWIHKDDPRGWFQWYCRYYLGRRHPDDVRQIKRWNAMRRHIAQIKNSCTPGDGSCHTKQRQALLHWAYDSRRM